MDKKYRVSLSIPFNVNAWKHRAVPPVNSVTVLYHANGLIGISLPFGCLQYHESVLELLKEGKKTRNGAKYCYFYEDNNNIWECGRPLIERENMVGFCTGVVERTSWQVWNG